jgi:acyl-[acyl-carrier-protein]-phospholipid O-acyltransferase/long-chain-fatty-acid--[acyl-carrier-protein] ligase
MSGEAIGLITRGGTLVVSNHVSLLDGVLIVLSSPVPLAVGVDGDYSRRNPLTAAGMRFLSWLGYGWVVPLDQASPFGMRKLKRSLSDGRAVLLFPEGRISPDGREQPHMPGAGWLVTSVGAPVVRARIQGAEKSRFFAKAGKQLWPEIVIELGV